MFQKPTRLHFNMDKSGLFVLPRRLKIFKTVFFSVKNGIKKIRGWTFGRTLSI